MRHKRIPFTWSLFNQKVIASETESIGKTAYIDWSLNSKVHKHITNWFGSQVKKGVSQQRGQTQKGWDILLQDWLPMEW